jgi:deoxyribodipyrimidine photo-lyase
MLLSCEQVAAALGAGAVFFNSRYEPAMLDSDAAVASQLSAAGLAVRACPALLLQEPWNVKVCCAMWASRLLSHLA